MAKTLPADVCRDQTRSSRKCGESATEDAPAPAGAPRATVAPVSRLPSRFAGPGDSPGFLLWQVTNAWQRTMRDALAPLELTHVQFVLLATTTWLTDAGEQLTQRALAARVQTDEMMTSQVVRALEAKGLVDRAPHPDDARARTLAPTPAGRELAARAIGAVEAADEAFFAALTTSERGFLTGLKKLSAAGTSPPPGPARGTARPGRRAS
jgi:MarR family transcriptional regulator, organic hydroperoxide resistance regulator